MTLNVIISQNLTCSKWVRVLDYESKLRYLDIRRIVNGIHSSRGVFFAADEALLFCSMITKKLKKVNKVILPSTGRGLLIQKDDYGYGIYVKDTPFLEFKGIYLTKAEFKILLKAIPELIQNLKSVGNEPSSG